MGNRESKRWKEGEREREKVGNREREREKVGKRERKVGMKKRVGGIYIYF